MTRLANLKRQAMNSSLFRNHNMSNFKRLGPNHHLSVCKICGADVMVNLKPQPNEIDIGGEAVALPCPVA